MSDNIIRYDFYYLIVNNRYATEREDKKTNH